MEAFEKAMRLAGLLAEEKKAQQPDYEWLAIRHQQKIRIRSLKKQAGFLNSLTKALQ